jgi:thioredoxin-related protein
MHTLRTLIFGATAALASFDAAGAAELVMVEQRGCLYCKMWHDQVGPDEYSRTAEGAFAPLRRIDLHAPYPPDLTFAAPLRITPTFVLVENGAELARMEGYPGEDFFWGLLGMMLKAHTEFEGETG